jgi:hypothetical protein
VLFFSRRVGLDDGQSVPIAAGGRVTGRVGAYTLGLLNIETGRSDLVSAEPTNFSVVRVRRDVLRRSTIGFIGTNRSPGPGATGANQAFGADATFAFHENVAAKAYYARTRTPGKEQDDASYLGEFSYTPDRYGFVVQHLAVGKNFLPEVGFLNRSDFRRHFASARFSPRPKRQQIVRKFSYEASVDVIGNGGYRLESREAQAAFSGDLQNSDRFSLEYSNNFEHLVAPFSISTDVAIPAGSYQFQSLKGTYAMGTQRRVSGYASVTRGSFYDGTLTEASYNGRVDVTRQFVVEPRLTLDFIDLGEGRVTKTVTSARTTFTATPSAFVSALLQYNSSSRAFMMNVRFKWEYQSGSDLYVVYSEGRDTDNRGVPLLQNRGFVVKVTRLLRF